MFGVLPAAVCALLVLLPTATAHARIIGINHTHWAINHFAVDGHSGLDIIGAWQGGGGGHISLPSKWVPGMTVRIDWETGVSGMSDLASEFPGFSDEAKYDAWLEKIDAQKRQHSKLALVPDYTNQKVCGITVHFLPCDEIQVTTSCKGHGSPDYPINIPLKLPEPQSCPSTPNRAPAQGAPL
ncbi:DUF3304 domain-containing protein [Pseudomonas sp. 148P]|uniref:DUF3304 domain-containing protein n=1 Tax=Pseudomonas ulcerans TaxID=3115852 RepID=A0ABU7HQV0_9PSED|nr:MULTISPECIES: DUF3304 domain-containing protein [unclassified Pseudomonas]MEE1922947.1 DUF3304 domain-containing protein [Pseudomonas sp. 147P]MEE1933909.1 DUF3304 domain-containing protein [Pseudomonas sp. 148P]